jgi:mRNA interferase YafQ
MMRSITHTGQFKRDYKKRARDAGLDDMLGGTIEKLAGGKPLEAKFRDHPLKGGYAGCRECHLRPDLLLIYVLSGSELRLVRLGSHSELFD